MCTRCRALLLAEPPNWKAGRKIGQYNGLPVPQPPVIIFNPRSGRGKGAKSRNAILAAFPEADLWETGGKGGGTDLAKKAMAEGRTSVLAAGGDGTINEVLNGLDLGASELGIIPVGTGNDLGRHIGIRTIADAAQAWRNGPRVKTDVGMIALASGESRAFVNVAGCGFDAAVAQSINRGWKFVSGTGAYVLAMAFTLARFKPPLISAVDGEGRQLFNEQAMLCSVANSSSYGGGMKVAPSASLTDGRLDIIAVRRLSRLGFLRRFPSVFKGAHIGMPEVADMTITEVSLRADPPMPLLVDGETWGQTPARISVSPGALTLVCGTGGV